MCTNKLLLERPDREPFLVSCRKCMECVRHRKRTYVGRALSEMQMCDDAYSCTLTYGRDGQYRLVSRDEIEAGAWDRDHRHAGDLHYEDPQLWMRRLRHQAVPVDRSRPVKIRFLTAGEFGSARGRAHWHSVVFIWNGIIPNLELYTRYDHAAVTAEQAIERGLRYKRPKQLWNDGFSWWEPADSLSISYCVKYITKAATDPLAKSIVHGSAGLGREFYRGLAAQYVRAGLSPQDLIYQVPDHFRSRISVKGGDISAKWAPESFIMSRAMGLHFQRAFVTGWEAMHGRVKWPYSDMLEIFLEQEDERVTERNHRRGLRARGAGLDEYGTVRDQLEIEAIRTRWQDRERMRFGLASNEVDEITPGGFNRYQAASQGW